MHHTTKRSGRSWQCTKIWSSEMFSTIFPFIACQWYTSWRKNTNESM